MKTRKTNKKMTLKKVTVTRLNGVEQSNVLGGVYTRETNEQQCTAVPYCPDDYSNMCNPGGPPKSQVCTGPYFCTQEQACSYMP